MTVAYHSADSDRDDLLADLVDDRLGAGYTIAVNVED